MLYFVSQITIVSLSLILRAVSLDFFEFTILTCKFPTHFVYFIFVFLLIQTCMPTHQNKWYAQFSIKSCYFVFFFRSSATGLL